jgi:CheY-like chemotaxis protein
LGKGSEFTLRLPRAQEGEQPAGQDAALAARPDAPQRILVVDDNVDAARSLEMLLRSLGHETRVVNDGAEALRAVPEFRPAIVLLDIGMPGIDGYEVARQLRAMRGGDALRIVAITGWGHETDRERSRQAGFDLHLVKPVEPRDLVRVLDERGGASLHEKGVRTLLQ